MFFQAELAVGGAGGATIISGVADVALHALWLNRDVKQAIDAPRLHNQLRPSNTNYEKLFPQARVPNNPFQGSVKATRGLSTSRQYLFTQTVASSEICLKRLVCPGLPPSLPNSY